MALSELLGPTGTVIAVDRDHRALRRIGTSPASWAPIKTYHADFTEPLNLAGLDGLLFLGYDTEQVSPWNPYPLPLGRLQQLAVAAGLEAPYEVQRQPSMFSGREFYAAVALKP